MGIQNDALFFISHIFDKLQKEQTSELSIFRPDDYDNYEDAWNEYETKFPSIIDKLFTGMSQKNISWNGCQSTNKIFETFTHITLELGTKNLEEAYYKDLFYEYHFETKCKNCGEKSKTETKEMIKLPEYLIFQINRYESKNKCKNKEFKEYPKRLKLRDKYESKRYLLNSFIIHEGDLKCGTYVAFWLKKDVWVKFDNSSFEVMQNFDELQCQAYILFYKRLR